VEAALAADDADRLAAALRTRQPEGKLLVREWARDLEAAPDDATRRRLARHLTALVVLYANVFGDREPLEVFRREGQLPEIPLAGSRLERAKKAMGANDPDTARAEAEAALRLLDPFESDDPRLPAVRSALHGVLGGVAMRAGDHAEAGQRFERSLEDARRSDQDGTLAAALLNRIDFDTRGGRFAESAPLLAEADERVRGGPFEEVWVKVLVERGIGLMRAGELGDAEAAFDHALRVRPDWPFPRYQRAWARFAAGDSSGALEDFRASAERARVFFTVQREIRCLEDVAAGAIPLKAYRAYCAVRERVRENADAVERTVDRILEDCPEFAPAHLLKAETRIVAGDGPGARAAAAEALSHDPDPDTASAALFLEWNAARAAGDTAAMDEAADRLATGYREHPAAMAIERFREAPDRNHQMRWTWTLDGRLLFEDAEPTPPDRTPPPPGSPG
jgi:tetratricopeptide (TPR) repeat protein